MQMVTGVKKKNGLSKHYIIKALTIILKQILEVLRNCIYTNGI
jgi:hypothetical protein